MRALIAFAKAAHLVDNPLPDAGKVGYIIAAFQELRTPIGLEKRVRVYLARFVDFIFVGIDKIGSRVIIDKLYDLVQGIGPQYVIVVE